MEFGIGYQKIGPNQRLVRERVEINHLSRSSGYSSCHW
jgi:hypothetical protein